MKTKFNTQASDFTIRLGTFTTQGSLLTLTKSAAKQVTKGAGKYVYCSPTGRAVSQRYVDDLGNVFSVGELGRASKAKDGTLTPVDMDAIAETKTSDLPLNVINLTVHERSEVDNAVFDADKAYVFYPEPGDSQNVEWYSFFLEMVKESDKALIGYCNFNHHEGLFRLTEWRNRLILQKIHFPEEVDDHRPGTGEVDESIKMQGVKILDKLCKPFDSKNYVNQTKAKAAVLDGIAPKQDFTPKKFSILDALKELEETL